MSGNRSLKIRASSLGSYWYCAEKARILISEGIEEEETPLTKKGSSKHERLLKFHKENYKR